MQIEIQKGETSYTLLIDGKKIVQSRYSIKQVHPDSNFCEVWHEPNAFRLYHVKKQCYIMPSREFFATREYSEAYKTFVAYYHAGASGDRCNLIYNDGNYQEFAAISISHEHESHRIFQLAEMAWDYFNEETLKFLCPRKVYYKQELGDRFLKYGSFLMQSGKRYLWYYDAEERKRHLGTKGSSLYKFKSTLSNEFIKIPYTNYFYGINFVMRAHEVHNTRFRIFYMFDYHNIDASEEEYENAQYLRELNSFLVKTNRGWTIVKYKKSTRSFLRTRCPYCHSKPTITATHNLVFVETEDGECRFYSDTEECSSNIWESIQFFKEEGYIKATQFDKKTSNIKIADIPEEYEKLKNNWETGLISAYKIYVPKQNRHTTAAPVSKTPVAAPSAPDPSEHVVTAVDKPAFVPSRNLDISYYCFGDSALEVNDTLISYKAHSLATMKKGIGVAWIALDRRTVYLVEYKGADKYFIHQRVRISGTDLELFDKNKTEAFEQITYPCPVEYTIQNLKEQFLEILKNDNTSLDDEENKDIIELVIEEPQVNATPPPSIDAKTQSGETKRLDFKIQETYQFVLQYAEPDKALEVIQVLYEDQVIDQLFNINDTINKFLMQRVPHLHEDSLIDHAFVELLKPLMTKKEVTSFNICFDFYNSIEKKSVYESLMISLKKCHLEKKCANIVEATLKKRRLLWLQDKDLKNFMKELFSIIVQNEPSSFISYSEAEENAHQRQEEEIEKANKRIEEAKMRTESSTNCEFMFNNKIYHLARYQSIHNDVFNIRTRDFVVRNNTIFIILPYEKWDELEQANGEYTILGEGKNHRENQYIGQNTNGLIIQENKQLLIFVRSKEKDKSIFYDEVRYISHKVVKDPNSPTNREIILFTLKSTLYRR